MMNRQKTFLSLFAAALTMAAGATATAAPSQVQYEQQVQSCVSEIGRHANYDSATKVRHTVVLQKETRLRYAFTIGTSVFTDSAETATREYTAYCVVLENGKTLQFSIKADV